MPAHAIATMKATLDLCASVFPSFDRKQAADVFVKTYHNPPQIVKDMIEAEKTYLDEIRKRS